MTLAQLFTAIEIRPLAGRLLTADDRRDSAGVVVVNETFARQYLGPNPIGRRITLPNPDVWRPLGLALALGERIVHEAEVVGAIPDMAQRSITSPVQPAVYVPHEQWTMRRMPIVVRAATDDPGNLIPLSGASSSRWTRRSRPPCRSTRTSSRRRSRGRSSARSRSSCSASSR